MCADTVLSYGALMLTRVGDQLELFTPKEMGEVRVPWGGVSPRALTRGYKSFIFDREGRKSMSDFVDPEQCDLWIPTKKAPWVYQGAPSLLPLTGRF